MLYSPLYCITWLITLVSFPSYTLENSRSEGVTISRFPPRRCMYGQPWREFDTSWSGTSQMTAPDLYCLGHFLTVPDSSLDSVGIPRCLFLGVVLEVMDQGTCSWPPFPHLWYLCSIPEWNFSRPRPRQLIEVRRKGIKWTILRSMLSWVKILWHPGLSPTQVFTSPWRIASRIPIDQAWCYGNCCHGRSLFCWSIPSWRSATKMRCGQGTEVWTTPIHSCCGATWTFPIREKVSY